MHSKKESPDKKEISGKWQKIVFFHILPLIFVALVSSLFVLVLLTKYPKLVNLPSAPRETRDNNSELGEKLDKLIGYLKTPEPTTEASSSGNTLKSNFTFALFNGTKVVGATKPLETEVLNNYPQSRLVARAVAYKSDYTGTIIIDLSGKMQDMAKKIAKSLNIGLSSMPQEEKMPEDADFLIIVGSDKLESAKP